MDITEHHSLPFTLLGEPTRWYIVYPSWAELSYRWEDLPELLADPLASPYTDPISARYSKETKAEYWRDLGFPTEHIEPARFINGSAGGGIISAKYVPRGKWLPAMILSKEANDRSPTVLTCWIGRLPFHVSYLEPFADPLRDHLRGKKRTKLYLCDPTPEHIESDPDEIYWAVGIGKGRRRVDALEQLPGWAKAFGLEVSAIPTIPEILHEEVSPWFTTPDVEFLWFTVHGGGNGAGYHYAVVLYLAMHLRYVVGPRMKYMHLLASIEGQPRIRVNWPHH